MNTSKFNSNAMYCINSENKISHFSTAGDSINQPLFDGGYEPITVHELYEKFGVEEQELCCVGTLVNQYGSGYGYVYCKEICDKYSFQIPEETDIYDQVQIVNTLQECEHLFGSDGFRSHEAFRFLMSNKQATANSK
jgi:hypothetical protein